MTNPRFGFLSALLAVVSLGLPAQTVSRVVPMCAANQLSFATDGENGNFDGMSHSGTLLVLRNLGDNACQLNAFPEIRLSGANGPLKVAFTTPGSKFMRPGPVMVPAIVAAGAEVTSSLRWLSSPVYDPGVCFPVTSVALQIGTSKVQTALSASVCGASASSVSVEKTRFVTDPVYTPASRK